MTPEEWQRAKPILAAALELDSANRASFLKEACADASLRDEIQSLIVTHEQAGTGALNSGALPSGVGLVPFLSRSMVCDLCRQNQERI
jgi:hypothetical protein